jgi:hypothetical protein
LAAGLVKVADPCLTTGFVGFANAALVAKQDATAIETSFGRNPAIPCFLAIVLS